MLGGAKSVVATAVSSAVSGAVGAAQDAIATVIPYVGQAPREKWTFGACDSLQHDASYTCYACFVPCMSTAEVRAYRKTGKPDAPPEGSCTELFCFCLCGDGMLNAEREAVRKKTNLVAPECCNAACCDDCMATTCCWGCAATQMKRELQVHFGHAGEGAPVHPGSPAALAMRRQ